ncbi:unnamed protein product [Arctogadus glacialis]
MSPLILWLPQYIPPFFPCLPHYISPSFSCLPHYISPLFSCLPHYISPLFSCLPHYISPFFSCLPHYISSLLFCLPHYMSPLILWLPHYIPSSPESLVFQMSSPPAAVMSPPHQDGHRMSVSKADQGTQRTPPCPPSPVLGNKIQPQRAESSRLQASSGRSKNQQCKEALGLPKRDITGQKDLWSPRRRTPLKLLRSSREPDP